MQAAKVSEYEGVATLRLVRCSLREAQMPGRIVSPRVRLEERVLLCSARLNLAPVAPHDVLPAADELLGLPTAGLVDRVGGHVIRLPRPAGCKTRTANRCRAG